MEITNLPDAEKRVEEIRKTLRITRSYSRGGPEFFVGLNTSPEAHQKREKSASYAIEDLYRIAKESKDENCLLLAYYFARLVSTDIGDDKTMEEIKKVQQEGREYCLALYGGEEDRIKTGHLFRDPSFGVLACSLRDDWIHHGEVRAKTNICSNCLEPLHHKTTTCPTCSYELINGFFFTTKENEKKQSWGRYFEHYFKMSDEEKIDHLARAFDKMHKNVIKEGRDRRSEESTLNRLIRT